MSEYNLPYLETERNLTETQKRFISFVVQKAGDLEPMILPNFSGKEEPPVSEERFVGSETYTIEDRTPIDRVSFVHRSIKSAFGFKTTRVGIVYSNERFGEILDIELDVTDESEEFNTWPYTGGVGDDFFREDDEGIAILLDDLEELESVGKLLE